MIDEKSSVESILEKIIAKIEVECSQEKKVTKCTIKRKLDESFGTNKRRKLISHEEEIYCRICYDTIQQLPIIYPCKCKVG